MSFALGQAATFYSEDRLRLAAKIEAAKAERKTAGPIHRRDLTKHIRRMEREARDWDRFHSEALEKSMKE